MRFKDLGRMAYRSAWDYQVQIHERVVAGEEEHVLFVEHEPVITFGRRPGVARHLVASGEQLARLGVEVVESDRGGDITFHGPGQIVVYPIIRLADHGLSISGYVHRLEAIAIDALKQVGIANAAADPKAPGVWVPDEGKLAKICAVGVRIRRGVSMHGIALNVATDLRYFDLIVPCGLIGRTVTSLQKLLAAKTPSLAEMRKQLQAAFVRGLP
jgi:lipoyl(octanoyl) transferase